MIFFSLRDTIVRSRGIGNWCNLVSARIFCCTAIIYIIFDDNLSFYPRHLQTLTNRTVEPNHKYFHVPQTKLDKYFKFFSRMFQIQATATYVHNGDLLNPVNCRRARNAWAALSRRNKMIPIKNVTRTRIVTS